MGNLAVQMTQTVQSLKKVIETMNKNIKHAKDDKTQTTPHLCNSASNEKKPVIPGQEHQNVHKTFEQTMRLFTKFKEEMDRLNASKTEMQALINKQKQDRMDFILKNAV